MPIMDGIEAAKLMREHEEAFGWPRSKIIAISAYTPREVSGIDDWLVKVRSLSSASVFGLA